MRHLSATLSKNKDFNNKIIIDNLLFKLNYVYKIGGINGRY